MAELPQKAQSASWGPLVKAAGVLIVRAGRVVLSPRGEHLGWIGGGCLPGESAVECARREALEEIGCEVEILHSPATYFEDLHTERLDPPAPLLRTPLTDLFRARALGDPRPVDVPELVWVAVEELADVPAKEGSVVGLLSRVVVRFGTEPLAEP